ncbi:MAG: divergent PAP2 family protein [Oscillospiraceae bacterium]|nr:divergent PAP2 family protein [Oscillospiraceae bacterium]
MREFINSHILWIAPIFSFIVAQLLKYVVYAVQYRVLRKERLTGAGGMPSSHSSGVCTMMVVMARAFGMSSPYFAIALMFGLIVMYDAAGVRRAAGIHAKVINMLKRSMDDLGTLIDKPGASEKLEKLEKPEGGLHIGDPRRHGNRASKPLKEFVGHTPLEVLVGAAIGVAIGFAVNVGSVGNFTI